MQRLIEERKTASDEEMPPGCENETEKVGGSEGRMKLLQGL